MDATELFGLFFYPARVHSASYMDGHGKMKFNELPARPDVMGIKKGDKVLYLAHGNMSEEAELKRIAEAEAALSAAAVDSTPAALGKTASATVAATTTAAIDAGSTAAVDAAPAAEAPVEAIDAGRGTAPTACLLYTSDAADE